jgi:hypothetical protein
MKFVPLLFVIVASPTAAQSVITVRPGESIQAAIAAASDGDTVVVQAGTYGGSLDFLGKAITVKGIGLPVISGGTGVLNSVVYFRNGEGPASVLQGFHIRGGFGVQGGGISCIDAQPTIRECFINANLANAEGGGVAGDCTLERCLITNNRSAVGGGGGVWGSVQMFDCIVERNVAYGDSFGGGLRLLDDSRVERCIIRENVVIGDGSAAYIDGANVVLRRCLITGNMATGSSAAPQGAVLTYVGVSVENCTICENKATSASVSFQGHAGICGPARVLNSIVGNNSGVQIVSAPFSGPAQVRYSDIEGGYPGTGTLSLAPLFTSSGNFHLTALSPCIDTGDPSILDPDGSRSDIGAFPFTKLAQDRSELTPIVGRWE